jgi:enterochelin esterase-like enzyme
MIRLPESPRFHVLELDDFPRSPRAVPKRPIYVYLPEAALQSRRKKFPVLYCHDGQNLWNDPQACRGHGGWYINEIVDLLAADKKIEPVIVVGIPHGRSRYREMMPVRSFAERARHPYSDFICRVVKPAVERNFPARKGAGAAALMGASLGGLVSLWMAHRNPAVFGGVACISGSFNLRAGDGSAFADYLRNQKRGGLRVYVDSGTVDDDADLTREVAETYVMLGWKVGRNLEYFVDEGGEHNERFWRHRLWRPLTFLFGI